MGEVENRFCISNVREYIKEVYVIHGSFERTSVSITPIYKTVRTFITKIRTDVKSAVNTNGKRRDGCHRLLFERFNIYPISLVKEANFSIEPSIDSA